MMSMMFPGSPFFQMNLGKGESEDISHLNSCKGEVFYAVSLIGVADHSYYDVPRIVREARCIVDTRNMTQGYSDGHIFRL